MKKKISILAAVLLSLVIHAQTIEKFSIDSGGASATAGSIEVLYTIGEVAVQEFNTGTISVSEGFINTDFRILIDPKVVLQGPILSPDTAGLMNDDLRASSYIPTTSPYLDEASCEPSVFFVTGTNAIVDWVWVELRAANDNTKIINARSALLQRDGDIVDLDGTSNLVMQAAPTNYFIVIKHRNHNGAITLNTHTISDRTLTTLDFRSNTLPTLGTASRADLGNGVMALWAGDANSNGQIKFSGANNDVNVLKDFILANAAIPLLTLPVSGYYNEDINLNGEAKFSGANNDSNSIKDIVLGHPLNFGLPTFTIITTVPNN